MVVVVVGRGVEDRRVVEGGGESEEGGVMQLKPQSRSYAPHPPCRPPPSPQLPTICRYPKI